MFKKTLIFLLLALGFSENLLAMTEFQELRFTNRARCALDSKKPSSSAFLLINNMDVARSIYRLAKSKGVDASELTQNGIKVYRYSIIKLLQLINQKLVHRQLPLLPADSTSENVPLRYRQIMQQCRSDEYCPMLDHYLDELWKQSGKTDLEFLRQKNHPELTCAYLKKFSPLEAQLFGTKPTKEVLLKIGEAASNVDEFLADCNDFSQQENVKVASFELYLKNPAQFHWNEQGFDYWNSLKIYFSWAFRHADEMKKLAFPFTDLFKAVAIEDSVILTPSNCKSLTLPKCESDYLNQNTIREFAKNDFKKEAVNLDILSPIPEGATKDLMSDPFSEVNRDILDFAEFKNSDAWLDNFRENFSGARTLMRKNLLSAVSKLDILTKNLDPKKMLLKLNLFYAPLFESSASYEKQIFLKNDLYYLCSEFNFAGNDELSFIKNKLNLLKQTSMLDPLMAGIVDQSSKSFFNYFDEISKGINQLCFSLDQKKIWDDQFDLDKQGFSSWYINKVYENKFLSTMSQKQSAYLTDNLPMLVYSQFNISKKLQDVVCINASDCARLSLKSILDLYAATQYADTFWNLNQQIKSPNLFNPYAERNACQVYDPWFKTKSVLFGFFTDVAQAGLSVVKPGVVFAKLDLEPGKVISFNQLVKDGKIEFDTHYNKQKINAGLALDFGKLLGVPCGVSISHTDKTNPYTYLQFQGISVRTCRDHETSQLEVNSPSEINQTPASKVSQCLVCSLNFEAIANLGGNVLPAASSTFFLMRALFRLYKGFTDPINIPHSWSVDPKLVKQTMDRFHGDIPKDCLYPLTHSQECNL